MRLLYTSNKNGEKLKNKPFEKLLFKVATEVANRAKTIAPVDTSNLKKDIQVFDDNIHNLEVEIGNTTLAPYAPFVHEGTGIYGKRKKRIKPKKAKALETPFGYFKSVAGQEAQPYLEDAAKEVLTGANLNKMTASLAEDVGEEIVKALKITLI